jgi:small acid-soluble spore protein I (minor)
MILSLRQAIYKKMEEKTEDNLFDTIDDAIGNDERTLPGLGVLFEVIWKNSDKELQDKLVNILREHLPAKE